MSYLQRRQAWLAQHCNQSTKALAALRAPDGRNANLPGKEGSWERRSSCTLTQSK